MGTLAYGIMTVLSVIVFSFALVALRREGSTDQGFIVSFSVLLLSLFVMGFSVTALIVGIIRNRLKEIDPPPPQPPWPTLQNMGQGGGAHNPPTVPPARPPQSPLGQKIGHDCQEKASAKAENPAEKVDRQPSPQSRHRRGVLWAYREEETE